MPQKSRLRLPDRDVGDRLDRAAARAGIMLYEAPGHPLTQDEVTAEAKAYYEQWMPKARNFLIRYETYRNISNRKLAVFTLHQAVEALYHCVLLVLTLYSPKLHRINVPRSQAESLDTQ